MKTEFPNYKLSKQEKEVVEHFENQSGFDLLYTEEVKSKKSFIACVIRNHEWLIDHAQEVTDLNRNKLMKLKHYMEAVLD